jgi:hypothetical protein
VYEANFAGPILNTFMSLDCRQFITFQFRSTPWGIFCRLARNRVYVDEKVDWFDGCDAEERSLLVLPDILKELDYAEHRLVSWYWCIPEYSVAECLLPMTCDADTIRMINVSAHHKFLRIYIDQTL